MNARATARTISRSVQRSPGTLKDSVIVRYVAINSPDRMALLQGEGEAWGPTLTPEGGFAVVGGKVSTERIRAMYRMDDMATWREYRRDLLREAEEARLARSVKEARPKRGPTLTGKVRRGAALLLSMVGLAAAPTPTRAAPARGGPN